MDYHIILNNIFTKRIKQMKQATIVEMFDKATKSAHVDEQQPFCSTQVGRVEAQARRRVHPIVLSSSEDSEDLDNPPVVEQE